MTATRSMFYFLLLLTLISAAIIGLMIGCNENKIDTPLTGPSSGSGPIGGGDSQKMKLTASPSNTITVIGNAEASAKVTAIVNNSIGQPMPDGTAVYWSATVGTLDSPTQTTSNGAATVTLTFPTSYSGCSTVSAESGDVSSSITICVSRTEPTATPTVTPTPSKEITVGTEKQTISNKKSTNIWALVTTNGIPEEGIQVTFSTSGGGTFKQSADITDSEGRVQVTFIGSNDSKSNITATITARTGDGRSGSITVIVEP
ncbi:hypothetical protein U14_00017 [Candidatus Moduliflexus flocculans]|uniref:Big-1 domain-containing protein n=1 Tax=Candidatus Moduliflexus flocculans TaxID=1499966 RepID=A0A0S6VP78_9BACT|nr:hypothetical protein U14_00017 [Candidatus Moduliflexus flocculans]